MKTKISAIIPIYDKGGKTAKCIESVLRQSKDILQEVICIDTTNSAKGRR